MNVNFVNFNLLSSKLINKKYHFHSIDSSYACTWGGRARPERRSNHDDLCKSIKAMKSAEHYNNEP